MNKYTVKELKEDIANLPDDLVILVNTEYEPCYIERLQHMKEEVYPGEETIPARLYIWIKD